MAKFGTGERYGSGWLYGLNQYLLGVGNIPSTEAFGTLRIFRIPKKLALNLNIRRLHAVPQIRRLKVTPDG
jgi:hypothetical protein